MAKKVEQNIFDLWCRSNHNREYPRRFHQNQNLHVLNSMDSHRNHDSERLAKHHRNFHLNDWIAMFHWQLTELSRQLMTVVEVEKPAMKKQLMNVRIDFSTTWSVIIQVERTSSIYILLNRLHHLYERWRKIPRMAFSFSRAIWRVWGFHTNERNCISKEEKEEHDSSFVMFYF